MSNLISVVIVDDDEMVAAAMSALCEKVKGIEVVGRANDGRDGLALVEKLLPQVALVDLMMPTLNGIDLVAMARRKGLPTRMVILTASRDPELCVRAMEAAFGVSAPDPRRLAAKTRVNALMPGSAAPPLARRACVLGGSCVGRALRGQRQGRRGDRLRRGRSGRRRRSRLCGGSSSWRWRLRSHRQGRRPGAAGSHRCRHP